ncbi:MAG: hypothetical protein LUD25_05015, partial [Coriobacteriaceae bacterium]|nr:hypothetical protein [Coriobacteriaceae bacterium]
MELQWPLILFTTFVAWSAGTFGAQCLLAFDGKIKKAQIPCWIVAAVLLVASGIAVFFHLQHWERIFNGFGHLTSGITQELIMIAVLAIVAIIYLVLMLRSKDGRTAPKWICVVGIVAAAVLCCVMANSYAMPARPVWDSAFWIIYVLCNALAVGPFTVAIVLVFSKDDHAPITLPAVIGSICGLVSAVAYAIYIQASSGRFAEVGYHIDPTDPTATMVSPDTVVTAFTGGQGVLVILGAIVIGTIVPLVLALIGRKRKDKLSEWKVYSIVSVVCVVAGMICMRVAFYNAG